MCYIYKMKGFSVKKLMKSVNVENVLIAVLVIVLVVLVVMYVNKNNEGFKEDGGLPELLFYNVTWCGYCTKAKENVFDNGRQWDSVKNKDKVKLVSVDCDVEKERCAAANVSAYPTVVLRIGDTQIAYEGAMSPADVGKFITQNV